KLLAEVNFGSRDNSRRPFAWDGTENHGFTTGTPWLPFATRSDEINLEADTKGEKSVCNYYRALFALRKEREVLRRGEWKQLKRFKKDCFVYLRTLGEQKILVVCNFEKAQKIKGLPEGKLLLSNAKRNLGANGEYAPYECAVYDLK
ncbi:MAG TPA: glucohydrolase, partial [Clostridiales bacterium]|nr:glucohydrolase [Clostridiales bacterium]